MTELNLSRARQCISELQYEIERYPSIAHQTYSKNVIKHFSLSFEGISPEEVILDIIKIKLMDKGVSLKEQKHVSEEIVALAERWQPLVKEIFSEPN